jgi:16S rRNA (cytosine1402-N4)-methyltransferase
VRPAGLYVDATFGRGGHSARILEALGPEGRLIAIDRDPAAIAAGRAALCARAAPHLVQGEFASSRRWCARSAGTQLRWRPVRPSASPRRSWTSRARLQLQQDGPLDMRMDPTRGEPVSAWLARASGDEMRDVIATLGEERFARRIAARSCARAMRAADAHRALAALVARAVRTREPGKHPATRTFQALRMFINDELGQIERGLDAGARSCWPRAGGWPSSAFHSLEDRLVKQFIRRHSEPDPALKRACRLTAGGAARRCARVSAASSAPRSMNPLANPRARSAVLRVAERSPDVSTARAQSCCCWCRCCGARCWLQRRAAIYSKYRARELFVELERLSSARDELDAEWGRLQLEQSAWSTYAFVERVASERLHMSIPDSRDIEIVSP